MEAMMEFKLDSVCGIYCGACPMLTVTRQRETGEVTYAKLPDEMMQESCHGCRSTGCGECDTIFCLCLLACF